jgi:hypothetical protein
LGKYVVNLEVKTLEKYAEEAQGVEDLDVRLLERFQEK